MSANLYFTDYSYSRFVNLSADKSTESSINKLTKILGDYDDSSDEDIPVKDELFSQIMSTAATYQGFFGRELSKKEKEYISAYNMYEPRYLKSIMKTIASAMENKSIFSSNVSLMKLKFDKSNKFLVGIKSEGLVYYLTEIGFEVKEKKYAEHYEVFLKKIKPAEQN